MPTNIHTNFIENDALIISWDPPYTYYGVDILYYNMNVNITSLEAWNSTEKMYSNITGTEMMLSLSNYGICASYKLHVCVQGVTSAGLGEHGCVKREKGNRLNLSTFRFDTNYVINTNMQECLVSFVVKDNLSLFYN